MKSFYHYFQGKRMLAAMSFLFFSTFVLGQEYTEIPLDEEEHFNILLNNEEPSHYSISAGANSSPHSVFVSFFTVNNQGDTTILDFVNVEIEDSYFVALIVGPNGTIRVYDTEFTLTLPPSSDLPPSGTIDNVQLFIVFFNSAQDIIGGLIRENMSITLEIMTPAKKAERWNEEVRLFPNPAHGFFILETGTSHVDPLYYNIYDANGKRLRTGKLNENRQRISTDGLPQGNYMVEVTDAMHSKIIKPIIIY